MANPISGRPTRVAIPRGSEAILGSVDDKGNVNVAPIQHSGTTPQHVFDVCAAPYNALPDAQYYDSGAPVTPGLTNHRIGFPVNTFSASDVGKVFIIINGCFGSSPADLHTTIIGAGGEGEAGSNPNGTDVILANSLTYGGVLNSLIVFWGTDNSAAIQAAHDVAHVLGHTVHIPYGMYLCNGTINWQDGASLIADGRGSGLQWGSGGVLVYSGTGTFINYTSPAAQPMNSPWHNVRITTCTNDGKIAVSITDVFGTEWYDVSIYGQISVGKTTLPFAGWVTCGISLTVSSFGNAFQTYIGCNCEYCAGDGIQITANTFAFRWIGGGLGGNGGWGCRSLFPSGGATANCLFMGTDFEGAGLGGVTGYFDVLEVNGCYLETSGPPGAGGPLIYLSGTPQSYARCIIAKNNYIAKWGTSASPIYIRPSGGCHTVVVEGNELPNPPDVAFTAARSLVTVGNCHRVRIGPNYSVIPIVDAASYDSTYDLGVVEVSYPFVVSGIPSAGAFSTNVAWDAAGYVKSIIPARSGALLCLRGWLTGPQSGGHYQVTASRVWKNDIVSVSNTAHRVVTVSNSYPFQLSLKVSFLNTGNASLDGQGPFAITPINNTSFELTGQPALGTAAGGDLVLVLRDSGWVPPPLTSPEATIEVIGDSGGQSFVLIEDYIAPGYDYYTVNFQTNAMWNNSSSRLAFVGEFVFGYKQLNTMASET